MSQHPPHPSSQPFDHAFSLPPDDPAPSGQGSERAKMLALLRRLEWGVKHAAESALGGEYRSAFRGRGMEFDQVVKYEYGDDHRDIDWNVTARLGEPFRKKYIEEREVTVLLLFEDTPSLQFGSGERTKREALMELAGILGLLAATNRDRFGLVYASSEGYWMREPARGRGEILHTCASLLAAPPPDPSDAGPMHTPWRLLVRAAPKHALFLWLSDFPPRDAPEGWNSVRRRFQALGFRIDDPWDLALPDAGPMTAFDPVAGRIVLLNTSSRAQRRAHAEWVTRRETQWGYLFPDRLSRCAFRTDTAILDGLVRFFRERLPGKHGARRR